MADANGDMKVERAHCSRLDKDKALRKVHHEGLHNVHVKEVACWSSSDRDAADYPVDVIDYRMTCFVTK